MKNYRKKEKTASIISKLILQILIIFVIATTSIILYDMYINIEVEDEIYTADRLSQEISTRNTKDVSTMLENVSESVVRHIKNNSK